MRKKGISLITLVITIIIVIILAGVVVLNLSNNNPIDNANRAKIFSDIDVFKSDLAMQTSSLYIKEMGNLNEEDISTGDYGWNILIPSIEGKKVGSTLYTEILFVSGGVLQIDKTKADEKIAEGKLTEKQKQDIIDALGGKTGDAPVEVVDPTQELKLTASNTNVSLFSNTDITYTVESTDNSDISSATYTWYYNDEVIENVTVSTYTINTKDMTEENIGKGTYKVKVEIDEKEIELSTNL